MENQTKLIEDLFVKSEKYIKSSLELYKLKSIHKSSEIISFISSRLILLAYFSLFFIILNIGIALWIGEIMEKMYLGFLIVSAFYGIFTIVLFLFRKSLLKKPVQKTIINQFLND